MSQSRAKSWRIALPLFVVLALTAVWCGYWLFALDTARHAFARLPEHGVRLDCAQTRWAGFPFRLTLICDQPAFRVDTGRLTLSGTGVRLSATARIYQPTHVIAELAGPSTLTQTRPPDPEGRIPDQVTLKSAGAPIRAGLQLDLDGVRRVTVRMVDWSGMVSAQVRGRVADNTEVAAESLALHWTRDAAASDRQSLALEASNLRVAGGILEPFGHNSLALDRVDLATTATRLPRGQVGNAQELLKAWQSANGELLVEHFAVAMGNRRATGTGTVRLDAAGRLDGAVDLTVKDLQTVFDDLIAEGRLKANEAVLASTALNLLAKGAPTPEPGWSRVPVRLSRGRLYFGPFKAAELDPLF